MNEILGDILCWTPFHSIREKIHTQGETIFSSVHGRNDLYHKHVFYVDNTNSEYYQQTHFKKYLWMGLNTVTSERVLFDNVPYTIIYYLNHNLKDYMY